MGLLDANIPSIQAADAAVTDTASMFRSTVHQAETSALAAQGFHQGESAVAFQQAHRHFVEVASNMNTLLDIAARNMGEGAQTYVLADNEGANGYTTALGSLPMNT